MSVELFNKSGQSQVFHPKRFKGALESGDWFLTKEEAEGKKESPKTETVVEETTEDTLIYISASAALADIDACESQEELDSLGDMTADCAKWKSVKKAYDAKVASL
jgi:hypothetical protein